MKEYLIRIDNDKNVTLVDDRGFKLFVDKQSDLYAHIWNVIIVFHREKNELEKTFNSEDLG